jgi:ribosomal protein L3 glutamine methyltransferase
MMSRRSRKSRSTSNTDAESPFHPRMTVLELIDAGATRLEAAGVSFGHGTTNAFDEAAWLVLWKLGRPLDAELDGPASIAADRVTAAQRRLVEDLFAERIASRQPAAYLTQEAWLQGVAFYVDHRVIVPRSLIAELLVSGELDYWLPPNSQHLLDLCTGGGSLAILAAMRWPELAVDATDISHDALAVAAINLERHRLTGRVKLVSGDGLLPVSEPYDLILCNPPYVNNNSMSRLPPEYLAEPAIALAGGIDGMDFVRRLLRDAPSRMTNDAALVLEVGNERLHFEAAFPHLNAMWLDTSAGGDQVCVLTRAALLAP